MKPESHIEDVDCQQGLLVHLELKEACDRMRGAGRDASEAGPR